MESPFIGLLNNRYQLLEELGQGGMGAIYRAHDNALDREVAIKILTETDLGTQARARLLHEAQAIARLNHPNIVTVYDIGECDLLDFGKQEGLIPFIVMEYIEGDTLYKHRPEDIEVVVAFAKQLCAALEHAHTNQIIHRDLKPENIIITPDGNAKLMDFGLARSLTSRLTSEGKLMGTVFYMAPEQALGQRIDLRADLYALGVILYELTTGELPFQADDPVAVISQHLHAPVVPPRAKNEQIPANLNQLIVRLMSKDPSDRPASAEVVRQFLESPHILDVDIPSAVEYSLLDRIVRGRMVGRDVELNQARQLWGQALSGVGQLLLISGEPGVGKSRLMREIATHVEVAGGQTYIGENQAEGNAPYAAFAPIIQQVLRSYSKDELEISDLVMAELIAIAPELQLDYPEISQNPPLTPGAEARRLFESAYRFIANLSARKPTLLVLEDLHWADSGTLDLLQFLAQRTRDLPVMLVGTYREVELDGALPFHEILLDLSRRNLGTRLKLERLDQHETQRLLAVIFETDITDEFNASIYKETEGNPFFIEEVCKALVESGDLYFAEDGWHRPDMVDLTIPQSIKVAIQSRLNKLGNDFQNIMLHAALIGREFDFEILMRVMDKSEDALINALETALKAQLVEERSQVGTECFWFSHALIPAVLRERISGLRRVRLYHKVASVVEEIHPEAYQRLAFYWGEAGDEEKGVVYLIKSAEKARKAYANQDAIRLYSEALALLPEYHEDRFDLLAARMDVYTLTANKQARLADCEAMLELANEFNDDNLKCKALLALAEFYSHSENEKSFELLSRVLEISQSMEDPVFKGEALLLIGGLHRDTENYNESLKVLDSARELFEANGLSKQTAYCFESIALTLSFLGDPSAAVQAANRSLELSRKIGDKHLEIIALRRMGSSYDAYKNDAVVKKAHCYTEQALETARQIGDRLEEYYLLTNLGIQYYHLKQMEESKRCFLQAFQISDETGYVIQNPYRAYFLVHVRYAGDYQDNLSFMQANMEKARQQNNISLLVFNLLNILSALFDLGRYQQVIGLIDEYAADIESVRSSSGKWNALSQKGLCCYFLGQEESGIRLMAAACESLESNPPSLPYSNALMRLALAKSYQEERADWLDGLEIVNQSVSPFFDYWLSSRASYLRITARLHLKLGQVDQAMAASNEMIQILDNKIVELRSEVFERTHAQVLREAGYEREADQFLNKAFHGLQQVAEKIEDDDLRQSYLNNVWENRAILIEADQRGIRVR